MNLSRSHWFIVALSAAMSLFGFWSFVATLPPIPEPMLTTSGVVASAEANSRRGRIRLIQFKVAPTGQEFSYPDILNNAEEVWARIDRDVPIEVNYTNPAQPELWGLSLAGETLITPRIAYAARRENGYWGLGLGVAFLCSCLYMLFVEGRRGAA